VCNTKFLIKNLFENNFETNDSDITFINMTEKRQTSQGYYPHFTTFRKETLEYYKFCDALLSCDQRAVMKFLSISKFRP
jgi:hypothetical protein